MEQLSEGEILYSAHMVYNVLIFIINWIKWHGISMALHIKISCRFLNELVVKYYNVNWTTTTVLQNRTT